MLWLAVQLPNLPLEALGQDPAATEPVAINEGQVLVRVNQVAAAGGVQPGQTPSEARALLPAGRFIEIYVKCPLEIAESRDPKGLYKKARAGEIDQFTGVSDPYEEPRAPEITVDTSEQGMEEALEIIERYLGAQGLIHLSNTSFG